MAVGTMSTWQWFADLMKAHMTHCHHISIPLLSQHITCDTAQSRRAAYGNINVEIPPVCVANM